MDGKWKERNYLLRKHVIYVNFTFYVIYLLPIKFVKFNVSVCCVLSNQQIYNFLRFCELLLLTCTQLKTIYLTTGCDDVRCILIFILGSSGFLSLSTVLERDLGMFFTCRC